MPYNFNELTFGHWTLIILSSGLAVLFLILISRPLWLSRRTLDKNERIRNSFLSGLYGYGFLISGMIAIGTISGAPIYSLACWSGFLLVLVVLSPMILFFGGSVYLNILGQDFYLNLNDKLSKKRLQQEEKDKKPS